jgi:hypothetical protein
MERRNNFVRHSLKKSRSLQGESNAGIYDEYGRRLDSPGIDANGCLTLGITGFVGLTLFKICVPIWTHLRGQDVHPVFVLLLIVGTLTILWFAVTRSLRSAWVRTVSRLRPLGVSGLYHFS